MNFKNGNTACKPSARFFGVKADELEALLNEWGEEGWEVVSTHILENANKINVIAKRPLTRETIRRRSMPPYNYLGGKT
jgi:hypothetical protein